MAQTQRDDILKAVRKREAEKWREDHPDEDGVPPRRKDLGIDEMTDFICGRYRLFLSIYLLTSWL